DAGIGGEGGGFGAGGAVDFDIRCQSLDVGTVELKIGVHLSQFIRLRQTSMRIVRRDLGEGEGRRHQVADAVRRQVAGVGRSGSAPNENAQPGCARPRFLQLLDLAHAHASRELIAFGDGALRVGGTGVEGLPHDVAGKRVEMVPAHAVPPTVMRSTLMVGIPTPTGTDCPSLPQTPMPSSRCKSFPTMLTYFNASGPLPMSVAPRTGRVILPSSIK